MRTLFSLFASCDEKTMIPNIIKWIKLSIISKTSPTLRLQILIAFGEGGGKTAFYSVMTKHVVWLSVKGSLWFHQQIDIKKMEGDKSYWTRKMAVKVYPG